MYTTYYRMKVGEVWRLASLPSSRDWQRLENAIIEAEDVLRQQPFPMLYAAILNERGQTVWSSDTGERPLEVYHGAPWELELSDLSREELEQYLKEACR